jgi:hypothetical protein
MGRKGECLMETLVLKEIEGDLYGAITEEMDKYLLREWRKHVDGGYTLGTYICEPDSWREGKCWSIRFPGATRGHIYTDNDDIILEVVLYDEPVDRRCPCYDRRIRWEMLKKNKYIGMKIIVEGEI